MLWLWLSIYSTWRVRGSWCVFIATCTVADLCFCHKVCIEHPVDYHNTFTFFFLYDFEMSIVPGPHNLSFWQSRRKPFPNNTILYTYNVGRCTCKSITRVVIWYTATWILHDLLLICYTLGKSSNRSLWNFNILGQINNIQKLPLFQRKVFYTRGDSSNFHFDQSINSFSVARKRRVP